MATNVTPPVFQATQLDGTAAVGFSLYSYVAGTDTPINTYQDYLAGSLNTNPIILDIYGMCKVWITAATKLVLKDLDGVIVFTADNLQAQTSDIFDSNGKYLIKFTSTANAINYFTMANAASGSGPVISVDGLDVNIPITVSSKATGAVILGSATSSGVKLLGDQPILDSSNNEFLKFSKTATAVNEITIANAAVGTSPVISATGGDTNIGINFQTKGTGSYGLLGTATQRGQLDLYEQTTNGVNKITFRSPAAITTNHALTFDGGGTDRTLTFGGDLTTGGAFTTASTFSTTGTFSSGGNFSTSSTFSQTGAYSATAAVSFTGAVTTAAAFTTAGANALTLTTTGSTNVTLPTTGTLQIVATTINTVKQQVFTAGGTYTPSTGMLYCVVDCIGSGAGGITTDGSHISSGGGGGSYSKASFTAAQIGASQTVTIGAGGTAGNAGNTSSLGSLITALGGSIGTSVTSGSAVGGSGGGTGAISGGTQILLIQGGDGGPAQFATSGQGAGFGGASFYGLSCKGPASGGAGNGGKNYGGGASGTQNGTAAAGGAGIIIINEFCNQ